VREEAVNVKEGRCTSSMLGGDFAGGGCGLDSSRWLRGREGSGFRAV
jgi:hypothetical protein